MRFISNMCWVKKGVSKTPTKIKLDKSEMKQLFTELDNPNIDENDEEEEVDNEIDNEDTNVDEKINKKYNMDDYDDEGEFKGLFIYVLKTRVLKLS